MLPDDLHRDVTVLAADIGERHVFRPRELRDAAAFMERSFRDAGLEPRREEYRVTDVDCANVIAEIRGAAKPDEIVVVGGHYDSVVGSPGANDNGSGAAATLALARMPWKPARTLRFVGFVNEEPPWFQGPAMGSLVHAKGCRARNEKIVGMLSLETMGCYSDEKGSQRYPFPLSLFYPSTGNFLGLVSNFRSRGLLRRCAKAFKAATDLPCLKAALPAGLPGVGWSDQWSFWEAGYDAIMLTDTAPFRYPHYHERTDTPDKIDYVRLAKAVEGVAGIVRDLVR